MLILSLDTTTRAGSAAVLRDGSIVHERVGDPLLTHAQRLPSELMRLLETSGIGLHEIDLFAVAAGPGSFTGLRVGIATIQGLALAGNRLVVPVSVLDALARAALPTMARGDDGHARAPEDSSRAADEYIASWMDAQRGEVFAALYERDARTVAAEPTSAPPESTLDAWMPYINTRRIRFVGDGAVRYRDAVVARAGDRAHVVTEVPPLAGVIGAIAHERAADAVVPHAIVPIYVRRSDAELARARRAAR